MGPWESLLTGIIDVPTWDRAGWKGIFFMSFSDMAPAMGILFTDEKAGRKIFTAWLAKIGQADKDNIIRVTIVEGSIAGHLPGYSVYIGPDFENIAVKANAAGENLMTKPTSTVGRFHRMNPSPGSPHLARFKADYKKYRHFGLIPAFGSIDAPTPELSLAVLKTRLHLRLAEDLTENDIERAVLLK